MFGFTREERAVVLFLLFALIVGSGITLLKRRNPGFAPELIPSLSEGSKREELLKGKRQTTLHLLQRKVNINTASLRELESLPGIGPSFAQRIIRYRTENGGFKSIEEIKEVKGIGEKSFQRIKELITIGEE